MIRGKNIQKTSALRQTCRRAFTYYQGHGGSSTSSDQYHIAAFALTALAVGTVITGSSFYTKNCQSLVFTGALLDNASTFAVVGENQFGDRVTETISLGAGSNVAQTTYCYRRVTSITILSGTVFGADDTLSVGYKISTTTAANLDGERVPLPYKITRTNAIKDIQWNVGNVAAANMHTYTVFGAPFYCIKINANGAGPVASASFTSQIAMWIDDTDPNV